jgi:hypothetical protein
MDSTHLNHWTVLIGAFDRSPGGRWRRFAPDLTLPTPDSLERW